MKYAVGEISRPLRSNGESYDGFHVMVRNEASRSTDVVLNAISGQDDDGEPCLTVMLPSED